MSLQQRIIDSLWKRVEKDTTHRHKLLDTIRSMTDDNLELFLQSYPQPRQYVITAFWQAYDDKLLLEDTTEVFVSPVNEDLTPVLIKAAEWTLNNLVESWDSDNGTNPLESHFDVEKERKRLQDLRFLDDDFNMDSIKIDEKVHHVFKFGNEIILWEFDDMFKYIGGIYLTVGE